MKGLQTYTPLALACSASTALAGALTPRASSITPITIKGNAFFAGNDRFYIRGVDYQPGGSSDLVDPLADIKTCKRDIEQFTALGINTLRVYTADNSVKHDECMKALADAGIYLALDLNTPHYSIVRNNPAKSYNHYYLQNVFATIDEFARFDNTLLFFSGNEVINDVPTSEAAPWVKAVTRDIKQYIGNRQYRKIPVGYSAADIDSNRVEAAHYMNCGTDDARGDFFGFNDYSWCNPSDFTKSTWSQKVDAFSDFSVPIFLSEYGCIETNRTFDEVATLYSDKMTPVYSGGLVYEYTQEGEDDKQKYGLVKIEGGKAIEKPDFDTLKSAFKGTPLPKGDGGFKASGKVSECPSASKTWLVTNDTLPAMPPKASEYFKNGAGDGLGLEGPGSQDSGNESPGTATAGSGQPTVTGTAGSSATSKGAASSVHVPEFSAALFGCALAVVFSSFLGASLL